MKTFSKHEKEIFCENIEEYLRRPALKHSDGFDVSIYCYVILGTYGMTVNKYNRRGGWKEKAINAWKEKTLQEILSELDGIDWIERG